MEEIKVTKEERLDKYLTTQLSESRATINKMIERGFVLVNNKETKPSKKLKTSDIITIKEGYKSEENLTATFMPLNIVFENDNVILINKPANLTVHPGSGNKNNTLVNGLLYYTNNLSDLSGEERPGIVHRIDKDTTGLILVAKNNKAHRILADDFKNKKVKREYIALLDGVFPHNKATIDAPIGRDEQNRKQMTVTKDNSKPAVTHLEVLKRYKEHTLVKLVLETGRTHQIRVHMKYIGFPVHNDPVYNKKNSTSFGQFLHSASITFKEPITHETLHFDCPLPQEFQDFLNKLES